MYQPKMMGALNRVPSKIPMITKRDETDGLPRRAGRGRRGAARRAPRVAQRDRLAEASATRCSNEPMMPDR